MGKIKSKCDTSYNWSKSTFIPQKSEIVVYSDMKQIKVGDGKSSLNDLPFYSDNSPLYTGEFDIIGKDDING